VLNINVKRKVGIVPKGWSDFGINPENIGKSFDFTDPNQIFLCNQAGSSVYVANLDSTFNKRWGLFITLPEGPVVTVKNIIATADTGAIVMGAISNSTNYVPFAVKINRDGGITSVSEINERYINLFPNPFINEVYCDLAGKKSLKFKVIDNIGKSIQEGTFDMHSGSVNLSFLKPGVYTILMSDENGSSYSKKLMKLSAE